MAGSKDEREGRARYLLGLLLEECGRLTCAAEMYVDTLRYAPGLPEALVQLGMLAGRRDDFRQMLWYFRQAILGDEAVVREAVRDDPPEVEQLRRILYGGAPETGEVELLTRAPKVIQARSVPVEMRASWAMLGLGVEQLKRGQDEKAAAALEEALKFDPESRTTAMVLALAYLLLAERVGMGAIVTERSQLWQVALELAGLLFA